MNLKDMTNEELFTALIKADRFTSDKILQELSRRVDEGDWGALYF